MDQHQDETFRWEDKLYELKAANSDQGYAVTVYEEGKPIALRTYTVGYLADTNHQVVNGTVGVQSLNDLAKDDIQKGWLSRSSNEDPTLLRG